MASLAQVMQGFDPTVEFNPPANWFQGRTLYGGLTAALALQAALRAGPADLPPLKSAQISFVGPTSEALRFKTQLLRQGKSATSIAVDCLAGTDIVLRAAFIFAHSRPSKIQHDFSRRPSAEGSGHYANLPKLETLPAFFRNFDVRFVGESTPVSGSDHPELMAWARHVDASGVDPTVALIALGDSVPPQ